MKKKYMKLITNEYGWYMGDGLAHCPKCKAQGEHDIIDFVGKELMLYCPKCGTKCEQGMYLTEEELKRYNIT